MTDFTLQLIAILVCSILSGLVGFWMSRRQYSSDLDDTERLYSREMLRLRRLANDADAKRRTLKQEVERLRRRAR